MLTSCSPLNNISIKTDDGQSNTPKKELHDNNIESKKIVNLNNKISEKKQLITKPHTKLQKNITINTISI